MEGGETDPLADPQVASLGMGAVLRPSLRRILMDWLDFGIGVFVGTLIGFSIAALLTAARRGGPKPPSYPEA